MTVYSEANTAAFDALGRAIERALALDISFSAVLRSIYDEYDAGISDERALELRDILDRLYVATAEV